MNEAAIETSERRSRHCAGWRRRTVAIVVTTMLGAVAGSAHSMGSEGKIAFARSCSIFVMTADGTGQRRLTHPKVGCDGDPVWSADGSRIAFVRTYDDPSSSSVTPIPGEIYVMRGNGTDLRRITTRAGDMGVPSWSPDGTAIAFDQGIGAGIVRTNGIGQRSLAAGLTYAGAAPSWSPRGSRIAIAQTGHYPPRGSISVVDPIGNVTLEVLAAGSGQYTWPAWSPRGGVIAFVRFICSDPDRFCGAELRRVDVRNRQNTLLARINRADANPVMLWDPSGARILVTGGRPGIWIMRADGRHPRALTRDSRDGSPTWSSDGRKISFMRQDQDYGGAKNAIYVMSADGSKLTKVAYGASPSWQPVR